MTTMGHPLRNAVAAELRAADADEERVFARSTMVALRGLVNMTDEALDALGVGVDVAAAIDAWHDQDGEPPPLHWSVKVAQSSRAGACPTQTAGVCCCLTPCGGGVQ